jgi:hypothetical protein
MTESHPNPPKLFAEICKSNVSSPITNNGCAAAVSADATIEAQFRKPFEPPSLLDEFADDDDDDELIGLTKPGPHQAEHSTCEPSVPSASNSGGGSSLTHLSSLSSVIGVPKLNLQPSASSSSASAPSTLVTTKDCRRQGIDRYERAGTNPAVNQDTQRHLQMSKKNRSRFPPVNHLKSRQVAQRNPDPSPAPTPAPRTPPQPRQRRMLKEINTKPFYKPLPPTRFEAPSYRLNMPFQGTHTRFDEDFNPCIINSVEGPSTLDAPALPARSAELTRSWTHTPLTPFKHHSVSPFSTESPKSATSPCDTPENPELADQEVGDKVQEGHDGDEMYMFTNAFFVSFPNSNPESIQGC